MFNEDLFYPRLLREKAADKGAGGAGEGSGGDEREKAGGAGGAGGGGSGGTGEDLETIEDYKSALEDARKDAAKYRTRSKKFDETQQRLEELEKGLKTVLGEGEEPDPEKLQSRVSQLQDDVKRERVKNVVTAQAYANGLDPDLTIAYLETKGRLKELDPADEEAIQDVVTKAVEEKSALKTGKPDKVGAGGGGNDGGEGTKETLNPIDDYRRRVGILPNSKK